jgi:hypothetical protein
MSDFNPQRSARGFPGSGHPRIQYDVSYWPIELESLCDTPTGLDPFTKIFLGSIARRVERSLNLPAQGIHLTVIDMQFVGAPLSVHRRLQRRKGRSRIQRDLGRGRTRDSLRSQFDVFRNEARPNAQVSIT